MVFKAESYLLKYDNQLSRIISITLGLFIGFMYAVWAFGKSVGEEGIVKSIFIPLGETRFHLHHWLLFSIYILIIYLLCRKYKRLNFISYFVMAFLLGAVIQGFTYSDWYILLK